MKKTLFLFLFIQFSVSCFAGLKDSIHIKTENLAELSVWELSKLAEAFEDNDDSHYALLCYLTILNKTKDTKDSELLTERALASKNMGIIYFSRGDYSRSMEYFLSSLKIYEGMNNLDGVASQLNNVGTIFFEWGEYDQALEHYQSSFRILDSLNLKHKFPLIFNNIGGVYLKTGELEKSLYYYQKSADLQLELGDSMIYNQLSNIGIIYQNMKNYPRALEYYNKSMDLAKSLNKKELIATSLTNIGSAKSLSGNHQEALRYLGMSLEICENENFRDIQKLNYSLISGIYEKTGDYKLSLDFFKRYVQKNDSIFNAQKHNQFKELQVLYETEKKEKEIQYLFAEKQLKNAQIRFQRMLIFLFAAGFLIIGILSIVLYFQKKAQKLANEDLLRKNLEIVQSEQSSQIKIRELEELAVDKQNELKSLREESTQLLNNLQTEIEIIKKNAIHSENSKWLEIINESREFLMAASMEKAGDEPSDFDAIPGNWEEQKKAIKKCLLTIMDKTKCYTEEEFNLEKLAMMVGTNKKYLSQAINEEFGHSFHNFINEYRIKEARKMLSDVQYQNYTIEAIANAVGFKSKSSFNTFFKKFTGLTPSYYQKAVRLASFHSKQA